MFMRSIIPLHLLPTVLVATIALTIGARPHINMQQETESQKNDRTECTAQLTASTDKERFGVGEPVTLKVVIKNNGTEECHLISRGARTDYELDVRNGEGQRASLTAAGERLKRNGGIFNSSGRIVLKAGEEHEDTISITDIYELTTPATYTIVASRKGHHQAGQGGKEATIKSNKVTITIE